MAAPCLKRVETESIIGWKSGTNREKLEEHFATDKVYW